jgi:hypothetical protein
VVITPSYPFASPGWQFVGDCIPFAPHVLARDPAMSERDLPSELIHFVAALRARDAGWTCIGDWSPLRRTHNLAILFWRCSRLICGSRFVGEEASLDPLARDHFARLASEGELPLGPPLSYPGFDSPESTPKYEQAEDVIEWLDEE